MNINQRIEQLEKELQELKQVVNQEQVKNKTPIGWVPEKSEDYYFVGFQGDIKFQINNSEWDDTVAEHYKVFQTEEEAEFYAEKLKVERELEKLARKFVYDEENWTIMWDYDKDRIDYILSTSWKENSIYFESEEKVREAVRRVVGEERIKKYYLEVE